MNREYPERLQGTGFQVRGVTFYTGGPQVFPVGVPAFDHLQLNAFAEMFDLTYRDDQFSGRPGDNLVESGARLCYLSHGSGRSHEANVRHLREVGHGSCYEHANLTVIVTGVSRGLTHELVRHRVGMAVSQVSSRYVDPYQLGFVVPFLERDVEWAEEQFIRKCLIDLSFYGESYGACVERLAKDERFADMTKGQLKKVARGCAREYLPIGTHQFIQLTLNARTARHIIRMRGNPAAEMQIQELAEVLAHTCARVWPVIMDDFDFETNTFSDGGI
jgi:thymidylate synthase (FAD)